MSRPAGSVVALWRYPVKSMQGEPLERAPVGAAGLLGDRAFAVVEAATGRVASAKHPRKWGALFACRAVFVEPPRPGAPLPAVAITLPGGRRVRSDDPAVDGELSRALGHAVRLVASPAPAADAASLRETDRTPLEGGAAVIRAEPLALAAPAGTWFDVAPVHLLTTAALAALGARAPEARFDVRRFRPNVVVDSAPTTAAGTDGAAAGPEAAWIGHALAARASAGDRAGAGGLVLRVIDPTPRCVVTTLGVDDLPADAKVLRTIARETAAVSHTLAPGVRFTGVVGVYATVVAGGQLARGDVLDADAPD